MMVQPVDSLEGSLKNEARFAAIEHLLCNMAASFLISSRKTPADIEAVSRLTLEAIRMHGLPGIHPEISHVVTTEIEDAVTTLYNLIGRHMSALASGTCHHQAGNA